MYPRADVPNLTTPLGEGLLQVRRTRGVVTTGIVPAKGNVTLDILEYLEKSEQKNCAMNLWVDIQSRETSESPFYVRRALGYAVHVVPLRTLEEQNRSLYLWDKHIDSLGPLHKWVLGDDPTKDMLSFVTAEFNPRIIFDQSVTFFCTCSEERAERALAIADETSGEVRCEFCGKVYLLKK